MASTTKNTFYLLVAQVYQKMMAAVYYFILARYLGVENFGKYMFVFALVGMLLIFIDFGFSGVMTREIARDKEKTQKYLNNILGFKLVVSLLSCLIIFFLVRLLHYSVIIQNLTYLVVISSILGSFGSTFYQVFRGHFNFKYEALGTILSQTTLVVVGVILMKLKVNLLLMILPYICANAIFLINSLKFFKRQTGIWFKFTFDLLEIKQLMKLSLPFFIAGIFATLYLNIDTILLSHLGNDTMVGLYNAAKKLPNVILALIPAAFSSAIYPALSKHFFSSKQETSRIFQEALFYLLLIILPIVFGTIILSDSLITLFYGPNYLPASIILKILILALPFTFFDILAITLLNACNRQKVNMINQGIGVSVLIIFAIILIPRLAQIGIAIAFLISYLFLFVIELCWVLKLIKIHKRYFIMKIGGIFLSCLIMSGLIMFLQNKCHLVVLILIGIGSYFLSACLLKIISKEELIKVKSLILFKNV
ncbi:MAG: flippase [Patescibacteria group bacterium]|jgi:O-antigen/teichoic acid export membrane protein